MSPEQHAKVLEARCKALAANFRNYEDVNQLRWTAMDLLNECAEALSIMRSAPASLGPGISRDDTVHGETYYTRKQVEEALRSEGVGWQPTACLTCGYPGRRPGCTCGAGGGGSHGGPATFNEPEVKP